MSPYPIFYEQCDTKHNECSGEQLEKLATSDERPLFCMAAQKGKNFSIGLGLKDLLDFSSSRSGDSYTIVIGRDGSKVELIEYDSETTSQV